MSEQSLEERVREAISVLTALRGSLASEIGEGKEESALHSTVSCVVVDAIDPAIRDLTQALEQPQGALQVRRATREDLAQIYPFLETEPEFTATPGLLPLLADLESSLERPHEVFLVASLGEALAGFVYAVPETSSAARIRLLHTFPEFRCRGVGRGLVARCVAILTELNIKEIGAFEGEETALASFLSAQGFRQGATCVWFSKDLAEEESLKEASGDMP